MPKPVIVCDIDMTLVDDTERRSRAHSLGMNGWLLSYFVPSTLRMDKPIPSAIASLKVFADFFDIIYLTNRTESMRQETEAFFSANGYPHGTFMMHPNTLLFDPNFKVKRMKELLASGRKIAKAYDDEEVYVNDYRRLGVNTYRVTDLGVWDTVLAEISPP